ncbi:MAG: hypothetical protein C4576_06040 [Desulfobacteraceae bacterium]|nr:MAG: hypothetical protein C4576_06040 [Desulfobacteraceae bacterium]
MIEKKNEFYLGLGLMIGFVVVLVFFFMPMFSGKNGLDYLDNLYNSISKGSAYYIPAMKKDAEKYAGQNVTLNLQMISEEQASQTELLFKASGSKVERTGKNLKVTGDLGKILSTALVDADDMYWNKGQEVSKRYGYRERKALYNWWKGMEEMQKSLNKDKLFKEAKVLSVVQKKAVETAYNYYTIEPQKIGERWGTVVFSLLFYVVYTLWYGFAILFMFEGWGLRLGH